MTDNNPKAVVLEMIERYNSPTGWWRQQELCSDDIVLEFAATPQAPASSIVGKVQQRARMDQVAAMFRDWCLDAHEVIADGERVAYRYTWVGTTTMAFGDTPPGARLRMDGSNFLTVRDGLIVRITDVAGPILLEGAAEKEGGPL